MTSDFDNSNRDRDRTSARTSHGTGGRLTRLGWIVAAVLLTPLLVARCGYAPTSTRITPSSLMQTTAVPSEATPCTMHYRDASLTWWPDEACATVDADGAWEIAVELGAADAPTRLDPTLYYVLRAWCPDNPSSPVQFWFDLAGPPAPYSSAPSPTTQAGTAVPSPCYRISWPPSPSPRRG